MRHQLLLRLVIGTALAGSWVYLGAGYLPAGTADASTSPLTVTCTTLSGNGVSQRLSGCRGSGAIAVDAGAAPAHGLAVVATKTIFWSNGKHTVEMIKYKDVSGSADSCASRAKYSKDYLASGVGYVESLGTTTKGMVGGVIRASLCVYTSTADPQTTWVVNRGKITI